MTSLHNSTFFLCAKYNRANWLLKGQKIEEKKVKVNSVTLWAEMGYLFFQTKSNENPVHTVNIMGMARLKF